MNYSAIIQKRKKTLQNSAILSIFLKNFLPLFFASLFPIGAVYVSVITQSYLFAIVWLIALIIILFFGYFLTPKK